MTANLETVIREAESLPIFGWDTSPVTGRWKHGHPPWDYREMVAERLRSASSLLDLGTGGGEFLSSLAPLPALTYATEGYPPNLPIALRRLEPLGVRVLLTGPDNRLDLPSASIELVVDRHEAFDPKEVHRVLRPGGRFVTQQVGGRNYREINEELGAEQGPSTNATESASALATEVSASGLRVQDQREAEFEDRFLDVGALVWYLRFAPWQVPDFSVARYRQALTRIHEDIGRTGGFSVSAVRLLVIADRPK